MSDSTYHGNGSTRLHESMLRRLSDDEYKWLSDITDVKLPDELIDLSEKYWPGSDILQRAASDISQVYISLAKTELNRREIENENRLLSENITLMLKDIESFSQIAQTVLQDDIVGFAEKHNQAFMEPVSRDRLYRYISKTKLLIQKIQLFKKHGKWASSRRAMKRIALVPRAKMHRSLRRFMASSSKKSPNRTKIRPPYPPISAPTNPKRKH